MGILSRHTLPVARLFCIHQSRAGKDIIYQSTDVAGNNFNWTGLYLVLAAIFWVFTTWYTARMIAYSRNDLYKEAPWVLYHFPRLLGYCYFPRLVACRFSDQ